MFKIDLKGPDGNAYALMAYAKSFGKQIGMSKEIVDKIIDKMTSSDYNNLLLVFEDYFGNVCELINKPKEIE
ncbi:uncharacterized protein METZ01_LOCUS421848 [marine metagenome]|jgi:hypothetical protein|uniref:Uncharacterized protein n=1 Tax=marine metagenome TaxID=408172 RepID=A0A382XDQ8_9ZZZZ|nr:hypothetical protein [Parcubacteria group bacterium]|tara:strand:+ start:993 stop:1208 length:216 start_codon:yes stop_codon:yes gene_type:complete